MPSSQISRASYSSARRGSIRRPQFSQGLASRMLKNSPSFRARERCPRPGMTTFVHFSGTLFSCSFSRFLTGLFLARCRPWRCRRVGLYSRMRDRWAANRDGPSAAWRWQSGGSRPTSATTVTATTRATPRIACSASTRSRIASCAASRIQSDMSDTVHAARPPCMRLCASHPAQTLDIVHAERRAADHSANIGSSAGHKTPSRRRPSPGASLRRTTARAARGSSAARRGRSRLGGDSRSPT